LFKHTLIVYVCTVVYTKAVTCLPLQWLGFLVFNGVKKLIAVGNPSVMKLCIAVHIALWEIPT